MDGVVVVVVVVEAVVVDVLGMRADDVPRHHRQ